MVGGSGSRVGMVGGSNRKGGYKGALKSCYTL